MCGLYVSYRTAMCTQCCKSTYIIVCMELIMAETCEFSLAIVIKISMGLTSSWCLFFLFQAEDGIRDYKVTGVQTCALPIFLGCANVIDMPTRQVFVVEMVGKDDLVNAVALNSAAFNGARIVGPAVAGLLIGRLGVAPAFLLNGLSFLVVIGALLLVRAEGTPRPRTAATVSQAVREGLRYALGTSRIALVLGLVLVVSLCVFNFTIVVPLVARKVLGLGAEGFGFLMAALGIGAVTGALSLATLGGRQTPLRTILLAGVLSCLALVALATAADFPTAVVPPFRLGLFPVVFMASCNTTLQLSAPDALRGRVMCFYTFAFGGAFPLGAFMIGAIAEALGVRTALVVAGSAGLVGMAAVVLGWVSTRTRAPR